jgi:MinD-like ATPase involved in chromosome partitioning or flagellar assembly
MSSIVIEAQMRSDKKRVATADLGQNNNQVRQGIRNNIHNIISCESCFWHATYETSYHDYDNVPVSQSIDTQYGSPISATGEALELFPRSLSKSKKPTPGVSFY